MRSGIVEKFSNLSVEAVRDYWNKRPCNIRHSPKTPGTREYFDEVEARKYFVEPHIPKFAEFPKWNQKRVLEIGCGIGTDTVNFARNGARVTAVELSEESLNLTRKRLVTYGLDKQVQFYQGNAEQLKQFVPVEPYDLIYSFGVIHHTPHPAKILEQLSAYLQPDGLLKLMIYHRFSWKVLWILLTYGKGRFWDLDKVVAQHSEAQTGCPVTYTYSRNQAQKLLKEHGFQVVEMSVEHIFPYRIRDYVEYRYVKAWPFRWMPESVFRRLENRFGWHLCITARRFPE